MRTNTPLAAALAFALALCAGAGCPRQPEAAPSEPPGREKERETVTTGPIVLRIDAADRLAYGAKASAAATVENRHSVPVAIAHFSLDAGPDAVARAEPPASFVTTTDAQGRLIARGRLLVENIGPMARAPAPPRWEWDVPEPGRPVASLPLLLPGTSLRVEGSFRATDALGGALSATVRWIPVEKPPLRTVAAALEPAQDGGGAAAAGPPGAGVPGPSGRWETAARATVAFAAATGPIADAARPLAWTKPADFVLLAPSLPPTVWPFALEGDLDSLPAQTASARREVAVDRPAFDVSAARARAGVASGPAAYLAPLGLWALGAGDRTALVTASRKIEVQGNALPLVEALGERGKVSVTLFSWAPDEDPDGLATRFRKKGFEVATRMDKGMTYRGVVEVTAENLLLFAEEVAAAGLSFADGTTLEKRAP